MMRRAWLMLSVGMLTLGSTSLSLADEFKLKTGETIRAEVVSRDDQNIVLNHPVFGRITLPVAQLAPVEATTAAGPVSGAPVAAPAVVVPAGSVAAAPANPAAPALPEEPKKIGFMDNWDAKFEVGASGSTGNSDAMDLRVGLLATKETDEHRWKFDTAYTKATRNGEETRDEFTVGVIKDWKIPGSQWFWWADGRYDYDRFKSWDHRASGHTGPGYEFIKSDKLTLLGRLGLGAAKEWGSDQDDVALEAFANLDGKWKITKDQTLAASTTIFPSLTDVGEFRARNTLDWIVKLSYQDGLSLKLGLIHEYESETDPGRDKNDLKYLASLLFDF